VRCFFLLLGLPSSRLRSWYVDRITFTGRLPTYLPCTPEAPLVSSGPRAARAGRRRQLAGGARRGVRRGAPASP